MEKELAGWLHPESCSQRLNTMFKRRLVTSGVPQGSVFRWLIHLREGMLSRGTLTG